MPVVEDWPSQRQLLEFEVQSGLLSFETAKAGMSALSKWRRRALQVAAKI